MTLCECGCGGEASPGCRFISGHNSRVYSYNKGKKLSKESKEKSKQKERETRRLNKLLKEGKIELPFCACGCGGRVRKLGNKYIRGHQRRGKPSWIEGLTKETNEIVKRIGEKISKYKVEFFATEEGQQWLDEYMRGENAPMYGKEAWSKGKTKETDVRLEKAGETQSRNKKIYFQTEDGLRTKQLIRDIVFENLKKGVYNIKPTSPELEYKKFCEKDNLPFRYTGDGKFWIGGKHRKVNPDFIESNGRRIAVEILGDYWHSPLLNKKVKDDDLKNREKHYRRYKWKVIYIWESDIMRPEGEKFVLSLLRKEGVI